MPWNCSVHPCHLSCVWICGFELRKSFFLSGITWTEVIEGFDSLHQHVWAGLFPTIPRRGQMDVIIIAGTHIVPQNITWFSYNILIIIFFYPIWIVISLNAFWITPLKCAFVFHNNPAPGCGDTSGQITVLLFGSHLFRITGANYLYGKRIKAQQLIATADPIFRYLLWPVLFGLELGRSFLGFPSSPLSSETSWGKWETAGIGTVGKGINYL